MAYDEDTLLVIMARVFILGDVRRVPYWKGGTSNDGNLEKF